MRWTMINTVNEMEMNEMKVNRQTCNTPYRNFWLKIAMDTKIDTYIDHHNPFNFKNNPLKNFNKFLYRHGRKQNLS